MNRHHSKSSPRRDDSPPLKIYFDPSRDEVALYDKLAEDQADQLKVNSAQLRRFFGEIKDLYRQFTALVADSTDSNENERLYKQKIEARFKMIRSKVFYAQRPGGQGGLQRGENRNFGEFLKEGIARVNNHQDFSKFVMHLEAVVGFMYGNGKVTK